MTSTDEFSDIPEWGGQFVDDIRRHLLQLSGQSYDMSIIEYALRRTFALAKAQVEGLSAEKRDEKITKARLLQLAEEAFTRQLLHWLSIDPSLYFDLLYAAFQQKIRHRIAFLLKKPEDSRDVEDCVQETFTKIFTSLTSKSRRGQMPAYPFTGWLYSVAKSICQDFWEKQKHEHLTTSLETQTAFLEQAPEDERRQPDMYVETKEREERVRACVERLPEPCRTCFRLFYYDGLPLAEIATRLSLPLGRVKTCIYQLAERRFRKLWQQESDK
jgi:RNA polymerase sigma factor (sigma-70 family)